MALALAASGVAAAQASAASIAVAEGCVINADATHGAPMVVNGAGFAPGDTIDLSSPGGAAGMTTAGPSGTFAVTIQAPILPTVDPAFSTFTLQAMDVTNMTTAAATFHVANLAVATNPLEAKPGKRVTWSFSGFLPGREIYVHYMHGKKVTATAKFGRAAGPCGTLKKKKVFYPRKAKYRTYTLQIDDSRHYSRGALPRLVATLRTHIPA